MIERPAICRVSDLKIPPFERHRQACSADANEYGQAQTKKAARSFAKGRIATNHTRAWRHRYNRLDYRAFMVCTASPTCYLIGLRKAHGQIWQNY
jgi:hypothetical protein